MKGLGDSIAYAIAIRIIISPLLDQHLFHHHLQRLLNHFSSPPHRPRSPKVLLLVLFLWRPTTVCSNLYAKTTHTSEMKPIDVACNNTLMVALSICRFLWWEGFHDNSSTDISSTTLRLQTFRPQTFRLLLYTSE